MTLRILDQESFLFNLSGNYSVSYSDTLHLDWVHILSDIFHRSVLCYNTLVFSGDNYTIKE